MSFRHVLAVSVIVCFVLYVFSSGIYVQVWPVLITRPAPDKPDFARYITRPRTLEEFLDESSKRAIIVGDIHGMQTPFFTLLSKLSYDPSKDVLIHTGDIIAKSSHDGSMTVLSYMTQNNITGVRGNHDEKVIEWRSWLEWMRSKDGGKSFLYEFHAKWEEAESSGAVDDPEVWAEHYIRKSKRDTKWWRKIPDGWKILSDHYRIAHAMSDAEYQYMVSLPLVLHIPSAHTFIAHGGVLPSDPRYKPSNPRQPLARVPKLPIYPVSSEDNELKPKPKPDDTLARLRFLQESSILSDIPHNNDPWVTLNVRGVLKDHSITRSKDGVPWSDIWNHDVSMCAGFNTDGRKQKQSKGSLPCYPATVVYGHAAARGLDVKRWSVGLDSGCVYEKRLSALVLDQKSQNSPFQADDTLDGDIEFRKNKVFSIPFDQGTGHIVSISCKP
ncbi:Metallo-dependent phosphatase-like protein [Roridomyces roridus]|uniref:Metallo-dependent phosphatase-like protein n=1 Tax=Roridomyces roridus TaxID=1738132 RepID=A0AAD7CJ42_9AGAR|nr:Metallo-dependent phosphatase-like protein [Roridomyces roridus]